MNRGAHCPRGQRAHEGCGKEHRPRVRARPEQYDGTSSAGERGEEHRSGSTGGPRTADPAEAQAAA